MAEKDEAEGEEAGKPWLTGGSSTSLGGTEDCIDLCVGVREDVPFSKPAVSVVASLASATGELSEGEFSWTFLHEHVSLISPTGVVIFPVPPPAEPRWLPGVRLGAGR